MNDRTDMFQELESGRWAHFDPFQCPCRGRGWLLSDLDTLHRCPRHGAGVPSPEDEDVQEFDMEAHLTEMHRQAFAQYRGIALAAGVESIRDAKAFLRECETYMPPPEESERTPRQWLIAAEIVSSNAHHEWEDRTARENGYSCGLEMRWAEDAAREKAEREGW